MAMSGAGPGSLAALLLAKVLCCGALVLVATGGLAGLGGWLSSGWPWLGAGAVLVAAGIGYGVHRRRRLVPFERAAIGAEEPSSSGRTWPSSAASSRSCRSRSAGSS
jgi:hypothetical protein